MRSLWGSRIYCRIVFGASIVVTIPTSVALFYSPRFVGVENNLLLLSS
jgi:hypothetical protein